MKARLPNPFKFGDPVDGDYFLPRPELLQAVRQFLESRIPVVLIGPRRFGKTSFLLDLLNELEKKSFMIVFVDIFSITSHRDFLQQVLRALKEKKSFVKRLMHSLSLLRPTISTEIDPQTGLPSFGLSMERSGEKDVKEMIQNVLDSLANMGEKVIFAIDEFQKVTEIDDKGWLEATLRTYMQKLKNTSFIFTGSRRSIIYDMLNNNSRPFYRSCQPIEFPSFGEEFTDWILQRFEKVGMQAERGAIEHLRNLVQNTPNYVQMVCFDLVSQGKKSVGKEDVESALRTVAQKNSYAYQATLNTLTLIQQRVLRLIALEGKHIYTKELLQKYEISSAAALASAVKALKEKEILDDEGTGRGQVIFDDTLFAIWLRFTFR